jgi:hypothetical protein
MVNDETKKLAKLATFLRVYGVLVFIIFGSLMVGFAVQTPLLEYGGRLNWVIWNGIRCGDEPCHVPPMLFTIYLVWGVFFFRAARKPLAYVSFLNFTMWANFFHALLMAVQTTMMMDRQWHRWFTDIPFTGLISVGIYLWRPTAKQDAP